MNENNFNNNLNQNNGNVNTNNMNQFSNGYQNSNNVNSNNMNQFNNGYQNSNMNANNMNQFNSGYKNSSNVNTNNMNQFNNVNQNSNNMNSVSNGYPNQYQNNTIVQPSMNPGYQVNNGMSINQNVQSSDSSHTMSTNKTKTKFPIIIVVVILGFFGLIVGGSVILNIITLPFSTKIIGDNISEARLSATKSSAYAFIDTFDKYVALSNYDGSAPSGTTYVKLPQSKSGIVKCSKIDSDIWQGEVLTSSSSCDEFMSAVEKGSKGSSPNGGEIIFDKNGVVQNGTYLIYKNIKCNYDNSLMTCEASKNDKNSTSVNNSTTSNTTTSGMKFTKDEENTLALVDAIEHYVLLNSMFDDTEGYEVKLPTTKSGTVICSKTNGTWTGEVLSGSSTCNDFMKKIESTIIGDNPTGGKVIISKDGEVLKGTWLSYDNNYCI